MFVKEDIGPYDTHIFPKLKYLECINDTSDGFLDDKNILNNQIIGKSMINLVKPGTGYFRPFLSSVHSDPP